MCESEKRKLPNGVSEKEIQEMIDLLNNHGLSAEDHGTRIVIPVGGGGECLFILLSDMTVHVPQLAVHTDGAVIFGKSPENAALVVLRILWTLSALDREE